MHRILSRAIPIVALLPLGGCPLFSASVDVHEMCVTTKDRVVTGVKPGEPYRRKIIADPLDSLGPFAQLDGEITSARVTLHASKVPDLMFLDDVSVTVRSSDPASPMSPLWLVRCKDYACASPTTDTSTDAQSPSEAFGFLDQGEVVLDVTLTGPLPEEDWLVDIEVCVSGNAGVGLSL